MCTCVLFLLFALFCVVLLESTQLSQADIEDHMLLESAQETSCSPLRLLVAHVPYQVICELDGVDVSVLLLQECFVDF